MHVTIGSRWAFSLKFILLLSFVFHLHLQFYTLPLMYKRGHILIEHFPGAEMERAGVKKEDSS
jgi:hypothetical protein